MGGWIEVDTGDFWGGGFGDFSGLFVRPWGLFGLLGPEQFEVLGEGAAVLAIERKTRSIQQFAKSGKLKGW